MNFKERTRQTTSYFSFLSPGNITYKIKMKMHLFVTLLVMMTQIVNFCGIPHIVIHIFKLGKKTD